MASCRIRPPPERWPHRRLLPRHHRGGTDSGRDVRSDGSCDLRPEVLPDAHRDRVVRRAVRDHRAGAVLDPDGGGDPGAARHQPARRRQVVRRDPFEPRVPCDPSAPCAGCARADRWHCARRRFPPEEEVVGLDEEGEPAQPAAQRPRWTAQCRARRDTDWDPRRSRGSASTGDGRGDWGVLVRSFGNCV